MSKRKEPITAEVAPPIDQWKRERAASDCIICGDSGLTDARERWDWCTCPAGMKKRAEEPGAVENANETLGKLKALNSLTAPLGPRRRA